MDITNPAVDNYLYSLLPARDPVLQEMEALAKERDIPIIGPVVARLLYQVIRLSKAKVIFEIGSAIGYSTIWMARAGGEGATVHYTDRDLNNVRLAEGFAERAGVRDRIKFLAGDALEMFDKTPGTFDAVFVDLDKHLYPEAFRKALPRIRKGGLLLADNVLWRGLVTEPPKDGFTRGAAEFNRLIYASNELFPVVLPVRDGLAVCEKL